MGDEEAKEVLRAFDPDSYVRSMSGGLPSDARLALGQIASAKTALRQAAAHFEAAQAPDRALAIWHRYAELD